ncbi:MAG: hypothetical protein V4793_36275 [Paraburkholderia tropica]
MATGSALGLQKGLRTGEWNGRKTKSHGLAVAFVIRTFLCVERCNARP